MVMIVCSYVFVRGEERALEINAKEFGMVTA